MLGTQWPRASSGGEALQDLLAPPIGEPERDPAIEIDPLEHNRERRVALRPPRIGQVLLRRIRDSTRPQEEGATRTTRRPLSTSGGVGRVGRARLLDDLVRP